MATWFECKVKYDKMTEDGSQKTVPSFDGCPLARMREPQRE